MASDEAIKEMKAMVASDLAAICKKVAENSAVPNYLRAKSRSMVQAFEAQGDPMLGEDLLIKMALFLPQLADDGSWYADY
jgi:hypothetical protein